ncbi:hypothetical protein ABVB40_12790, partial [Staphylococcus cohnii]
QEIILLNLLFKFVFSIFAKLLLSNLLVPTVTSRKSLWVTVKLKKHLDFLRPNDIKVKYYTHQKTLERHHHRFRVSYIFNFIVMML